MKVFAYIVMLVIILIYIEEKSVMRICKHPTRRDITVSTVTVGIFSETFPQTGTVINDSTISVPIDQLYLPKISIGMDAVTTYGVKDIPLRVEQIDSTVVDGRFNVYMQRTDTTLLIPGSNVRLRLSLTQPQRAILLPIGGFYKDTRGEWVFVTADGEHYEKRMVTLGHHNSEYFPVLAGLRPGEKVLTSSYEDFTHKDTITRWEIELRRPISLM
jgi:HlyD family secretion protein